MVEALPPVPLVRLQPDALRSRLADPPPWQPEAAGDPMRLTGAAARPAAVLVPLVRRPHAPTVLLTERPTHLAVHAGQIAFPGGRSEPHDASAEDTALREAFEEIGLRREQVELIGRLPRYRTGTGFDVTPVIGLVEPDHALRLDPNEVAEAFEVPLPFLMDPANHQRRIYRWEDGERSFFAIPYRPPHRPQREYFIWGATAAMLRNLYRLLAA
ncbi:MAG TPA: CoA pyrophosphatase [Burkholderiaceae bacterium]|nr:CoA pyrophosphatase [Burkholderiaceae bacterium]